MLIKAVIINEQFIIKDTIMALLLVTYELNNPSECRPDLLDEINRYSNVRLSDTSYAIITDKAPSRVCGEMKEHIDSNDKLFIINLKSPYDGYGSKPVSDWLKKSFSK